MGTSSVRAALYDGNADLIPRTSAKIEYQFVTTADGGFEIDANILLRHVVAAVDAALKKSSRLKGEIKYVASCSFWHSLMGVHSGGKPTTPLFGWADRQSREYSAVLKKRFNEKEMHNRTGAHFHSSFWPAKLLWLRKEHRSVFDKTARWLSFADYVSFHLTGSVSTSISMASATGLFDQRKFDWDAELLKYLKLKRSQLPTIVDGMRFKLTNKFSRKWPRLKHAIWFPAIGDGAADHMGSCGIGKSKVSLMVGTSAAMRVAYHGPPPTKIPSGLWCYRIDGERVIVGGALSDGGNLCELIKRGFKLPAKTDRLIQERGTADDDLIVLPFFFGERSTGYDENARGAIIGLRAAHDGVDILRAAMEGVAFRLADIFDRLKKIARTDEIVASGGALRESPLWTQIIADVLGHDLTVSSAKESSSKGAVLLALETLGKIEKNDIQTKPRPALH